MNLNKRLTWVKILVGILALAIQAGCASRITDEAWPSSMPDKSIFVEAFHQQQARQTNSNTLKSHLIWIQRFYLGSMIYPLGWNRMTEMLLDTLDHPQQRNEAQRRLYDLGLRICLEWSQDNAARKINTAAVATWGNALRTSAQRGEQLEFIARVEDDVDAIMAGKLKVEEITDKRYYPPEDYDNF